MAKFCSNCGNELDENADICLKCGVLVNEKDIKKMTTASTNNNKKSGLPTWAVVLIILGCVIVVPLIIILIICIFAFNAIRENGSDYLEDAKDYLNDYLEDYDAIDEGTIGDTLEVDGIRITLNNVHKYDVIDDNIPEDGSEYLVFFLNAENITSEEKLITYLNFNGLVDDDTCLPKLLFNEIEGTSNLNKELEAGDNIDGYVVFEVEKGWENFDLNYRKILNNKGITFYVTNEKDNNNEI